MIVKFRRLPPRSNHGEMVKMDTYRVKLSEERPRGLSEHPVWVGAWGFPGGE